MIMLGMGSKSLRGLVIISGLLLGTNAEVSSSEDFPRPVIILLGPTGVGKSSLANTLLGQSSTSNTFPVGHGTESFTQDIKLEVGHWLGDPAQPRFTLVDTPGTGDTRNMDCEHALETVKFLKEVVGSIDMFVFMFKGTNIRFDASMQKQLELFESIFGPEMWDNAVTEITFWQYTQEAIEEREIRRQDEESKHEDWNKVYQKKFDTTKDIPTIFIDPIYDSAIATERESTEFLKWTRKLWDLAEDADTYSCKDLCSAPDSFFVGDPLITTASPHNVYEGNSTTINCYVWVSGCFKLSLGSVKWSFNGEELGEQATVYNNEVAGSKFEKYMVSTLRIESMSEKETGQYTCSNTVGTSSPVVVRIKADSVVGQWGAWSACSKKCVGYYERFGSQSRTRSCRDPVNGGLGCRYHGLLTETRSCAGDEELPTYCPSPATWSLWTHWESCDRACLHVGQEKHKQTRRRFCKEGENSDVTCDNIEGSSVEERECLPTPEICPSSIRFTAWTAWSECTQDCVNEDFYTVGGQFRNRTCEGNQKTCQNFNTLQVRHCNLHRCPGMSCDHC